MRDKQEPDLLQGLILGALCLLSAGSALVAAVGWLAGSVFGAGAPKTGFGQAGDVLWRLPAHLADPAAAWPVQDAARLPGPVAMYASAAAVVLPAAALAAAFAVAMSRRRQRHSGLSAIAPQSAAFATSRDIADLVVQRAAPGRVVLGHAQGRLIATQPEHSVLVLGATRSGKTTGFAIPAVREWSGPVIVLSAKTDLLHATYEVRSALGDVLVYDPTGVSGKPTHGWSPLARTSTWAAAVRTANAMSRVSGTTGGLGGAGKHWERVAAQLLAPMLLAASTGGLEMSDVVRWAMTKELEEPKTLVDLLGRDGEVALRSMRSYLDLEPRARDSAFSTVRTVLDAYEDPAVSAACVTADIRGEQLLDGGSHTLYIVAGSTDQARLAPVLLAMLDEIVAEALRQASLRRAGTGDPLGLHGGRRASRLLLLLDEAANIAPLPDLATLASTAGGEGVQLVTIFQDLSQLRHRYGTEWGSIASNHVTKVILPGVTDPETLSYFSSTVGDEEVLARSTSRSAGGRKSTSESVTRRPVVSQRDVRELPLGNGLCLYGARPPIRFQLRR